MTPAQILDHVRSYGANVVLVDGELRVVNGNRLPANAVPYLTKHRDAILAELQSDREDQIAERAAIVEFEAGVPRQWAEQFARICFKSRPAGVSELDWSWFVVTCGRIIDEAPPRGISA